MINVRYNNIYLYLTSNKKKFRTTIIDIILNKTPDIIIKKGQLLDILKSKTPDDRWDISFSNIENRITFKHFINWIKDFDLETYVIIIKSTNKSLNDIKKYQKNKKKVIRKRTITKDMTEEERLEYNKNYQKEYRIKNKLKQNEYEKKYRTKRSNFSKNI